ncbi:MAG: hypothetical protein IIT86_08680, partial [Oscillospiraceae bacterium]|nr:hypothetical protein [Oscillospiraceae bacterium]
MIRKRLIALFLALILITQILPLSVLAEEIPSHGTEERKTVEKEVLSEQLWKEAETDTDNLLVVGEVEELRGESEKHFRMEDGSFVAVDYGMPVHYTDDGGASWKEIDNTLVLSDPGDATRTRTMDDKAQAENEASYNTENGENGYSFAASLQNGFLFSTQDGSHSLRMLLSEPTPAVDPRNSTEAAALRPEEDALRTEPIAKTESLLSEKPVERTETSMEWKPIEATDDLRPAEAVATAEPATVTETTEGAEATMPPVTEVEAEEAVSVSARTETDETDSITETAEATEEVPATEPTAATEIIQATEASTDTQATEVTEVIADTEITEATEAVATTEPTVAQEEPFDSHAVAEIRYPENEVGSAPETEGMGLKGILSQKLQMAQSFASNTTEAEKKSSEHAPVRSLAEQVMPKKLKAEVLYRNVYQDVDLQYELCGYNVKETILVNRPREQYCFPFYLDLKDLTPVLQEDGSVELRDAADELIYLIPAP